MSGPVASRRPWLASVLLTLLWVGCGGGLEPTHVARHEPFVTGDPAYDRFFTTLHGMQTDLSRAPGEEQSMRAALSRELGLTHVAPPAELGAQVRQRVAALREAGVRVRLVVDEGSYAAAATATLHTDGEVPAAQRAFVTTLQWTADTEAKLMVRLRRQRWELTRLLWQDDGLGRSVDQSFATRTDGERGEVQRNLDDARAVIPMLLARASEVADAARRLLAELEQATSEGLICRRPAAESERASRPRPPAAAEPTRPEPGKPEPDFEP